MPYLLLLPVFIYYAVFWLAPVVSGIIEVFTDSSGRFTLFDNFDLMLQSDQFRQSVLNTAAFAAISVVLQYFLALMLAVLLNRKFKGAKLLTFVAMIPMAITPTAVAILWKTGLVKEGWINTVLLFFNIVEKPIVFLNAEGFMAVLLIILIDTWTVTPSVMIILLAGLQGMQKDLKEAAYTFGAGKWRIFTDITLPILKPSIITSVLLRLIAAIQTFMRITLPLAFPALAASSMYAFLTAWNDTISALILTDRNQTLALVVYKAIGTTTSGIQYAAAGSVILILPALVFTFIIRKYVSQMWGNVEF